MNLLKLFHKKMSSLEIALFFRQLSALIAAGIPIVQSFEILCKSQKNKLQRQLMTAIKINIEAGNTLSWCLSRFPQTFDPLTCHLIQTGEQSGTLSLTLDRIALHKEKLLSLKNKIKQALWYPAIVIVAAGVVSVTMLTLVIPRFVELFQSMHSPLPLFTLGVIRLSEWIRQDYWLALFPLSTIVWIIYSFNHSLSFRYKAEYGLLQMPYLGPIYMKTILTRFCRTLATMFAAGVPISESLKTMAYASGSTLYTRSILNLQIQITKGQQLHQAMQKQVFFPHLVIQMVKIGEESGTLERMLEKIATLYEADIDHSISSGGHVLEPLLIAILGVLIGGLVIAMYLPIFKLGTVI